MAGASRKKTTWRDLKHRLSTLDQAALIGLIQDLYRASKDNQAFLHARFALGENVLAPYKAVIHRWVCPDVLRNQDISVSRAKKAIADYRRAIGHPEGLAELSVFYCESCAEFLGFCGMDDESYFNALIRMFDQALKVIRTLDPKQRAALAGRLSAVWRDAHNWGWGVADDMGDLMAEYGLAET